jgi:hypothetical protein
VWERKRGKNASTWSVADSIAGLSSYVRGVMTMPQLQQRETDECHEGITSPLLGGPTPPDLVIGRDAISPTLHPGVTQMDEVANDHQTFMITSEGQIIPCEGQLVPYSSSHSDGDGLLSHRILLRNIEGQQIVIKDDGGTEGLLSDAALVVVVVVVVAALSSRESNRRPPGKTAPPPPDPST